VDLKLSVLLQMLDKASAPLRKVQGAGKGASEGLRKTRDELRELDKQQARLTGFRKLKRQLQDNKTEMASLAQKSRQLNASIAAGGPDADKNAAALKRVTKAETKLSIAHREQLEKLRQVSGELGRTGIRSRNLGSAEEKLRSDISRTTASMERQTAAMRAQGVQAQKIEAMRRNFHKSQAMAANLSIAGYASFDGGRRILGGIRPMINEGKQYQTNVAQMRAQGASNADIGAAERFANRDTTRGSSINDKLEILKDANSIFRDMGEAVRVAPQLLKAKYTFEGLMSANGQGDGHGKETVNELIDAIRTGELRNATKTPEAFNHMLDMMSRAYVGSGGLVKPSDYLMAMKVGGVAAKQMDEKSLFFGAMHTIQEMGGMRAGTGLASAYQNWAAGRSTQQTAEALDKLGLVNKGAVKYGKTGHITKMLPGALVNQGLYESNPFAYMMKEVIPRINPTGKLSDNEVVSKLNSLFSARKAGDLFAGMYMQRANIEKQLRASAKFGSLDSSYNATGNTAQGQEIDLEAKKRDLYLQLGRQLLPVYVGALGKLVAVLRTLTAWAQRHPAIAKGVTVIAATFGVLMVAAGGLMIALGGLVGQFALLKFAAKRAGLGLFARGGAAVAGEGAAGAVGRLAAMRAGMLVAIGGISAPILVLMAVLAAAALVIWHYWQPIKAWFIGFGKGISDIVGPALTGLLQALAPLKPIWDALAGALGAVWHWFTSLVTPMQATREQLDGATANGVAFGRIVGYWLSSIVTLVRWVATAFTWVGTAIGTAIGWVVVKGSEVIAWLSTTWAGISEAVKAPFVTAFAWISEKIDALLAKWNALRSHFPGGGDALSAAPAAPRNWDWNDGRKPPPRFASSDPLRVGGNGSSSVTHVGGIKIIQQPGESGDALAKRVRDEIAAHDRAKAVGGRSSLTDHE
jgi:hypothetical protein